MRKKLTYLSLAALIIPISASCGRNEPHNLSLPSMPLKIDEGRRLSDASDGTDWAAYGRTYGEQHYSPLTDIRDTNVSQLGLAWSMDLGAGNPATIPIEVGGILYFANGLSVVHAIDARSGKLLWVFDSETPKYAGDELRQGWGSRGIAYWNRKVYTATPDGRLIAIDAITGKQLWTVSTVTKGDGRYITGAPRVFDGKIVIGHGGADSASVRGYVTTYDAETGRQLWRFFVVPGNPANGFEDAAQRMAAKTWAGEWWKYGGGGTVWNAITYDAGSDTVLLGTGNGAPWNRKVRSQDHGDNLFLCSIVALDAKTGAYKWHYQINPGETWDYNASMDIALADLVIEGRSRKVAMIAPKNGFFYVIDRTNGKLISAEKFAKVTWATRIDTKTGRPVEVAGARFPNGQRFELWPSMIGAHSWMPMAFSPKSGLVYIPKIEAGAIFDDRGIDIKKWVRVPGDALDIGVNIDTRLKDPLQNTSSLVAWNPSTQRKVWDLKTVGGWNGGVMATGGNLVFQGQLNGRLSAYSAATGKELWHFDGQAPIISAPITYKVGKTQYVTILVGMGTSAGSAPSTHAGFTPDFYAARKRVLTFALGASARLPAVPKKDALVGIPDPNYRRDDALALKGMIVFGRRCIECHGVDVISGGIAPDLRGSAAVASPEVFDSVVRGGALKPNGMPQFQELRDEEIMALRQYILSRAAALRDKR